MSKRIAFSKSIPLPAAADRDLAVALLHDHNLMISLNPKVFSHGSIHTPRDVIAEEATGYKWYQLSEDISHFSGGKSRTIATYKACYLNLRSGIDFHIYGPQGLDVKERWTLTDSSADQVHRDGNLDRFQQGLYLRRDCSLKYSIGLPSVMEKNLYRAHQLFIEKLSAKIASMRISPSVAAPSKKSWSLQPSSLFGKLKRNGSANGSVKSRVSLASALDPADVHPAFRNEMDWSAIPSQVESEQPRRPLSFYSESSSQESRILKKRPNFYGRRANSSLFDVSNRLSFASTYSKELPPSPLAYNDDDEKELSLTTSLSPTQIVNSARVLDCSRSDIDSVGSSYSNDEEDIISRGNSTPSLTDETSDEEFSATLDEPQTPSDELSVLEVIRQLRSETLVQAADKPPPIPQRAEGHTVPAPLRIRSFAMPEISPTNLTLPDDFLPTRSTSMRRGRTSRRSSRSLLSQPQPKHMSTEETERALSLAFEDGLALYS